MIALLASIEDVVFDVSNLLRVPVLIAILLALAAVLVELGALAVELLRRRSRPEPVQLEEVVLGARLAVLAHDPGRAAFQLRSVATSPAMAAALVRIAGQIGGVQQSNRMAKSLADFDLGSLRRLERTRFLVRAGPALGLMGTLIPLAPALSGLANGNVTELTDNLRIAFSITVLGLLVGAIAFGISLLRDRLYAQDLSDLEFVAATLDGEPGP